MDFTINKYRELLESLKEKKYLFAPFIDYHSNGKSESTIILRHDVDRLPENALMMAEVETEMGIRGSYYFRVVPESFDEEIIRSIALLSHEVGYHYEDVDLVVRSKQYGVGSKEEIIDAAWKSFKHNLEMFRKIYPVKTICMHGSPLSKYDNRMIWTKYDYKSLGIVAAAYYDIDWDEFAYLTDTGRRWNGGGVSVRDKVVSKKHEEIGKQFRRTQDIIDNVNMLPPKIMFTIHPERWSDNAVIWTKQLVAQKTKNVVKRFLVRNQGWILDQLQDDSEILK